MPQESDDAYNDAVQAAFEEEVEYLRQDLKYIRKYVTEDRYAKPRRRTSATASRAWPMPMRTRLNWRR
jgi:ribosomal protein S18